MRAGAAIATLVSEAILLSLLVWRLERPLGWPKIGSRLAMSGVATACFSVPLAFLPGLPVAVAVPLAAAIYFAVLLSFKEIRRDELSALAGLFVALVDVGPDGEVSEPDGFEGRVVTRIAVDHGVEKGVDDANPGPLDHLAVARMGVVNVAGESYLARLEIVLDPVRIDSQIELRTVEDVGDERLDRFFFLHG